MFGVLSTAESTGSRGEYNVFGQQNVLTATLSRWPRKLFVQSLFINCLFFAPIVCGGLSWILDLWFVSNLLRTRLLVAWFKLCCGCPFLRMRCLGLFCSLCLWHFQDILTFLLGISQLVLSLLERRHVPYAQSSIPRIHFGHVHSVPRQLVQHAQSDRFI